MNDETWIDLCCPYDNPRAFPASVAVDADGDITTSITECDELANDGGMRMLDYFAAKAMGGVILNESDPAIVARLSYDIAERMLFERKKRMEAE